MRMCVRLVLRLFISRAGHAYVRCTRYDDHDGPAAVHYSATREMACQSLCLQLMDTCVCLHVIYHVLMRMNSHAYMCARAVMCMQALLVRNDMSMLFMFVYICVCV